MGSTSAAEPPFFVFAKRARSKSLRSWLLRTTTVFIAVSGVPPTARCALESSGASGSSTMNSYGWPLAGRRSG
jgi:hypothetical protein